MQIFLLTTPLGVKAIRTAGSTAEGNWDVAIID